MIDCPKISFFSQTALDAKAGEKNAVSTKKALF